MIRVLAIAMLFACGSKKSEDPGPSCGQVMDHILEVTQRQLVGHGDELKSQRAAMVQQCEARKMPAEMRKCLLDSKSMDDIAKCKPPESDSGSNAPYEKPRRPLPKK
jgi:hypothetical protein